ncbi:MAG: elongation factor G [Erysipelotrichaceae bacterium]|nr:elongation factor G [Erysipelotrichaceae bacterium]
MKEYAGIDVRNVCLTGHTGAGKTEVLESILFNQKITERFGKAVDGNSIIDSDPEEVKRGMSVYTSLVPVEWKNKKINFMDAPGYLDFAGEQAAAMAVCENVVIVVNAKDGVQSGTMKAYRQAVAAGKPVIFFVTRVDEENANFENVVAELERRCKAAPLVLPVIEGGKAVGTVNIITKKAVIGGKEAEIPADFADQVEARYAELCEAIAMTDDELTEKFLMEEPFTEEEMLKGVKNGMVSGAIKPIICGSATKYVGIEDLLNIIVDYCHSYVEKGEVKGKDDRGNEVVMKTTPDEAFSAFIFKTVNDAFAQISYVKVMSGTLTTDVAAYNCNKEENEKIGSIITLRGKNQEKITKLEAGDIGAVLKLQNSGTNDTLATKAKPVIYAPIEFPRGMLAKAIWPKSKNDEDKLSTGLAKIREEDPACQIVNNTETREQVLYGVGDQHIDVIVNKLKNRYKVEVELTEPKVQYRETIMGTAEVQGKHKKQSGGAGQYGDVWIRFEHNPDEEEMVFAEEVVGGAVPKQYFPAVEAGLRECMTKGVLAGYKVVQVKATLYDGSFHPVDSKEIAFKSAARLAYKAGMPKAKPTLLEPIIKVNVTIPADYVGAIYGDFSKRRGMILENNAIDDETTCIVAEVPQAEMMSYATELRSMTQGNGSYTSEFVRYDRAPQNVVDKVVAEAKIEDDED